MVSTSVVGGVASSGAAPAAVSAASGLNDAASAESEDEAQAIAAAFDHEVVVESLLSETETVSANPDGTFHYVSSSSPVRVWQDTAEWADVDLDLVKEADGTWAPKVSPTPVKFAPGGSTLLASLQAPGGTWTSQSWGEGTLPAAQIDGNQATYPEVLPGVDVVMTATVAGFSEVVVVKDKAAAQNPALDSLQLGVRSNHPLTGVESADGMDLKEGGPNGEPVARVGAAIWWDSRVPGSTVNGPSGGGTQRPADATYSSSMITVDADAITDRTDIAYPLYIDPAYSWSAGINGGTAYTYVDQYYPDASFWNGGHPDHLQHVGYTDGGSGSGAPDKARAFWRMDTLGLAGKHILSAEFNAFEVWAYSCSPRQVNLYEANSTITSGTTWNNQPSQGPFQGSANVAYGWSTSGVNGPSDCSAGGHAVGFNAMPAVTRAAANRANTTTLMLRADNEGDKFGWKKFRAGVTLDVTYNTVPNSPSNRITGNSSICTTDSTQPKLATAPIVSATASDPDGSTVRVRFEWWTTGGSSPRGSALTSFQSSGSRFAAQIPSSAFAGGPGVSWRARTEDGTDISGWTNFCQFTLDSTAPVAPALTSNDFPDIVPPEESAPGVPPPPAPAPTKFQGETGTVTLDAHASGDVTKLCYTLNSRPTVCAASTGILTISISPGLTTNKLEAVSYDGANNVSPATTAYFKMKPTSQLVATWALNAPTTRPRGWRTAAEPYYFLRTSGASFDDNPDDQGLLFDGVDDYATSEPQDLTASDQSLRPLLDTAQSFTIRAEVKVDNPAVKDQVQTFVAAAGQSDSAFYLQYDPQGRIRFAVTSADSTTRTPYIAQATADQITSSCGGVVFDQTVRHTFSGVYDKADNQIQIWVDKCQSPAAQLTVPATWSATGKLMLGTAQQSGVPSRANQYAGRIYNVWLVKGAMTNDELVGGIR